MSLLSTRLCRSSMIVEAISGGRFWPMNLNILLGARLPVSVDELVAASLRQMSDVCEDNHAYLVSAGKELAVLLGGEFNRLKSILGKIKH